jgi:hypothetical protein
LTGNEPQGATRRWVQGDDGVDDFERGVVGPLVFDAPMASFPVRPYSRAENANGTGIRGGNATRARGLPGSV